MPLKGPLFNGSMPGPMAGEPYVFRTPADEARRLKGRQDDARTAWLRESPEGRALAARRVVMRHAFSSHLSAPLRSSRS